MRSFTSLPSHRLFVPLAVVLIAAAGLTACDPDPSAGPTTVSIAGGGFGHGVGMSQFGARGRADGGQTASQILAAYYPNTAVADNGNAGPSVHIADRASTSLYSSTSSLLAWEDGGSFFSLAAPGERVSLQISGTSIVAQVTSPSAGASFTASGGGVLNVAWSADHAISVSAAGHDYAYGRLRITPRAGSMEVVVAGMSMDQYLFGLGEVPTSWPSEAQKAQAVAGRTYAAYRQAHPQSSRFDIYSTVYDQAYVGADHIRSSTGQRWVNAVVDTTGDVLTHNGKIIQAFYASSNGGYSEDSGYVWATSLPYLAAAPDPYDNATGNSRYSWTMTYSGDELGSWLNSAGRGDVGRVSGVDIGGNIGQSGRVEKATVTVRGSKGSTTMTGAQFRLAINRSAPSARDLPSTKFAVSVTGTEGPGTTAPPATGGSAPFGVVSVASTWGPNAVIAGWVVDGDTPRSPTQVLVSVNGALAGAGMAGDYEPALAGNETFGADHRYAIGVSAPGSRIDVCAWALDTEPFVGHTLLGCRTLTR